MRITLLVLIWITFSLFACQNSGANSAAVLNQASPTPDFPDSEIKADKNDDDVWTPAEVDGCLASVKLGEPFDLETSINPFYLRGDLDGNGLVDYAILIRGRTSKLRGVVICKDSKQPFTFGPVAKLATPLSSFDDDNFITHRWVIATKEFTKANFDHGGRKISAKAQGESVLFVFEGSRGVTIYWDGRNFRIGE